MKLHLAGVNHFDPLGPGNLLEWLTGLFVGEQTEPCFIAVEWDELDFNKVRPQRPRFSQ